MPVFNPFRENPCANCETEPTRLTKLQGVESLIFCSPECNAEYNGIECNREGCTKYIKPIDSILSDEFCSVTCFMGKLSLGPDKDDLEDYAN